MGFQQGLSGLNATSKNLEIIGNNVANANTYGSKVARAEFNDVYAAALSGAGTQPIGIGTNLAAVAQQFTQGNITTTSNPMDLAINGAGFFQVKDGNNPPTYTRNGQFKVDRSGYIVNNSGAQLMGYPADGQGRIQPGQASAIQLPTGGIDPNPTQSVRLEMNLDARLATTNPAIVARESAQSSADDLSTLATRSVTSSNVALSSMTAALPVTTLTTAAVTAFTTARDDAAAAAAAAATAAAGYGSANQVTATASAVTAQTTATAAKSSAQAALIAIDAALAVDPANASLITARTTMQDAATQADAVLAQANMHVAAVGAVPSAQTGAQISFSDADTYNNATSLTLFDAKGQEVALTYYFQKAGTDVWNVYATANKTTVAGTNALPQPIATLRFSSDGGTVISPNGTVPFNVPPSTNAAGAETMAITGIQLDLSDASQFGSAFGVTDMSQDGFAAGQLTSIAIEANGIISARYSNGQSRPAGQIEVATFRNPQGLQPIGDNGWASSFASGDAVVGVPGDGNLGVLQAGALEESNVDITAELVNMITAQRIYQANAQSIKTIDQVMQTIVNLR
jgi:flagellar hook protein FlgE